MTPEQREELKQAALAADKKGQHIYTNPRDSNNWDNNAMWHAMAGPEAVLSLIAQVEALTVPQIDGCTLSHRAVLGICDAYESGIGHGMQRDQHSSGSIYGNPDHGTAYEIGYEEGKGRSTFAPTIPAIPGTKEATMPELIEELQHVEQSTSKLSATIQQVKDQQGGARCQ